MGSLKTEIALQLLKDPSRYEIHVRITGIGLTIGPTKGSAAKSSRLKKNGG